MRALLRKELREHWLVLTCMWVFAALTLLALQVQSNEKGSPMTAYHGMVFGFAPLLALLLASRLVVREYNGRTQLFLETLPISRSQVLATKWGLGAALLLLTLTLSFGVTLLAARSQVSLNQHYIGLVAIRSMTFLLFIHALAFAIGLTGRYRFLLWALLVGCAMYAMQSGQMPVEQWPPFHLVRESMIYERLQLPLREVLLTALFTAGLLGASFALALGAEGSFVVALSRRMAAREKATVTVVIIALISCISVLEARKEKPLFVLAGSQHSKGKPDVAVALNLNPPTELALAEQLSGDLRSMTGYLAIVPGAGLSLMPDETLDGGVFQRATLPRADGVVLRAAFASAQFDNDGLRAYALSEWLRWHSFDQAASEERRWLLDGFAQWSIAQALPQRQQQLALRAALAARLLRERHLSVEQALGQWFTAREQLGGCLADALAWDLVSTLHARLGEPGFQAFARAALAEHRSREAWGRWSRPSLAEQLALAHAPDLPTLARQVEGGRGGQAARFAAALDALGLAPIRFKAAPMAGGGAFEVAYQVGAPGAAAAPFAVRYVELKPWDGELAEESLARVDATANGVLPASFARGTRLFTAVERRIDSLGCTARLAAQRWELK